MITPKKRARKKITDEQIVKYEKQAAIERKAGLWELVKSNTGNRFTIVVNELYCPHYRKEFRIVEDIRLINQLTIEIIPRNKPKFQITCWDRKEDENTCQRAKNKWTVVVDKNRVYSSYSQRKVVDYIKKAELV